MIKNVERGFGLRLSLIGKKISASLQELEPCSNHESFGNQLWAIWASVCAEERSELRHAKTFVCLEISVGLRVQA